MAEPTRYLVPASVHRVEATVKRSRFVTTAGRATDPVAAHAFVGEVRRELPGATHHCFAFVAGPPGSTARIGMSDAGEPHGTAGRPMLTVLLHAGVGEIVVVCSRWYGGVKLGTGGLSRAYADGVTLVLATLPTVEKVDRSRLVVTIGYADVDALRLLATELGATIEAEDYGSAVRYHVGVPTPDVPRFREAVAGISQGRATVELA